MDATVSNDVLSYRVRQTPKSIGIVNFASFHTMGAVEETFVPQVEIPFLTSS